LISVFDINDFAEIYLLKNVQKGCGIFSVPENLSGVFFLYRPITSDLKTLDEVKKCYLCMETKLAIAAKALKLAVEEACRLIWINPGQAEKILMRALKRAEKDGI
jgi:hypothetical protein